MKKPYVIYFIAQKGFDKKRENYVKDLVEGWPLRKLKAIKKIEVTTITGTVEQVLEYLRNKKL